MKKAPSPLVSLIPIIVLVLLLFATIRTFGSDALSGGSQVSLLTTTAICILIGMVSVSYTHLTLPTNSRV